MTDSYESGYQDGRFDGYVEAMDMARDDRDKELEAAWRKGADVPINHDEDAMLEADWPDTPFVEGDYLEEVWEWFDHEHSRGLAWLMYEIDKEMP